MGLFDGATAPTGEGAGDPGFSSTAHVAKLLGAPVVLVIDASAAGRSVAAVATGFDRFDPAPPWPASSSTRSAPTGTNSSCGTPWPPRASRSSAPSGARTRSARPPAIWA